jgi:hypothetical protein
MPYRIVKALGKPEDEVICSVNAWESKKGEKAKYKNFSFDFLIYQ